MDKKPEDRRVRYTKMVLKNALMELMKVKPLSQITIVDICKTADINRNTFYQHYASPYALFSVIEAELLDKIITAIQQEQSIEKLFYKVCKVLEENAEFSHIIFSQADGTAVIKKVLILSRKLKEFKTPHSRDTQYVEKLYLFIEAGVLALLKNWVLNGFDESPEILSKTIFRIVQTVSGE